MVFASSALKRTILAALNSSVGEVSPDEMLQLTFLRISDEYGIVSSLEGVQYARQLQSLTIYNGQITNLSPLEDLELLTELELHRAVKGVVELPLRLAGLRRLNLEGYIDSVVFPEDIRSLEEFTLLSYNPVQVYGSEHIENLLNLRLQYLPNGSGISFVTNLVHLRSLNLNGSYSFTNLAHLSAHTELTNLVFSTTDSMDFSELNHLTKLSHLALWRGIAPATLRLPEGLVDLRSLYMYGLYGVRELLIPDTIQQIEEIQLLNSSLKYVSLPEQLPHFSRLGVDQTPLEGVSWAGRFPSLRELSLRALNLVSPVPFAGLTNLVALDLSWNRLPEFALEDRWPRLEKLTLNNNCLTQFLVLSASNSLSCLSLGNYQPTIDPPPELATVPGDPAHGVNTEWNRIRDLRLPTSFQGLVCLDLTAIGLTNLDLPSGLTQLTSLYLAGNKLTRLIIPPDAVKLADLTLTGNRLETLGFPSELESMQSLSLPSCAGTNLYLLSLPRRLEQLSFSTFGIKGSLRFPDHFPGLELLSISTTEPLSLEIPSSFTRLKRLQVSRDPGNELAKLFSQTQVKELQFDRAYLYDFTVPLSFMGLQKLDLSNCSLTNLVLPKAFSDLVELNLDRNYLSSLNIPSGYTHLETLSVRANRLTEFRPPSDLRSLRSLRLGVNRLERVVLPLGLENLQELEVDGGRDPERPEYLGEIRLPAGNPWLTPRLQQLRAAGSTVTLLTRLKTLPTPAALRSARFEVFGAKGNYVVQRSKNLKIWSSIANMQITEDNWPGVEFSDPDNTLDPSFYRVTR